MKTIQQLFVCAGFFASLTGASIVHSADARSSATATIIAPVNVPESATTAYTHVLFRSNTGTLSIRVPIAPTTTGLVQSACGWAMNGGGNSQCNAPTTLQILNDGTLTGQQGVSLSVTRESNASRVVMAMLNYN
jgi:hypothetical protein